MIAGALKLIAWLTGSRLGRAVGFMVAGAVALATYGAKMYSAGATRVRAKAQRKMLKEITTVQDERNRIDQMSDEELDKEFGKWSR